MECKFNSVEISWGFDKLRLDKWISKVQEDFHVIVNLILMKTLIQDDFPKKQSICEINMA